MTKALMPLVLAGVLAGAGCAARTATAPAPAPAAAKAKAPQTAHDTPPSPPPAAAAKPAAAPAAVPRTEPATVGAAPVPAAPVPPPERAAINVPQPPAGTKTTGEAPPATASAYVYSPQQAASATHPATAPQAKIPGAATSPEPVNPDPVNPSPVAPAVTNTPGPGELQLAVVTLPSVIAAGGIVTVDVMASSDTAVLDAPLHLSFDPNVMAYVDGAPGDFLTQGGSSVVFLADGSTRPGDVAVAAGRVERSQGAMGSGLLCRVRLKAVASGTTQVMVGQAKAWGVHGEELTVRPGGSAVSVR